MMSLKLHFTMRLKFDFDKGNDYYYIVIITNVTYRTDSRNPGFIQS
jgi:hypothetical protein